ncbi:MULTISPECIES: hypothetical protein [Mesorhizobium]|uniref:Uncharacterized protein n=1 Tax=Mesorhizobium denitrificans TaxID=2294114 RepID=A0A371XGL3_9HYPH|nr:MULTISPECIES: hypothetical protein [Mesorhizobium]RFC68356.1 hypothetical protein DY251_05075 [Mesorhizobium denitrificans]
MAKEKKTGLKSQLPFISYTKDASFEIDDNGFEKLQEAYDTVISETARKELVRLADTYLDNLIVERNRQTWADAATELAKYEAAVAALWQITCGEDPRTDALVHIEHEVIQAFDPIPIYPGRGDIVVSDKKGWEPFAERFEVPDVGFGVRIKTKTLLSFTMGLRIACDKVKRQIEEQSSREIVPTEAALDRLVLDLTEWAQTFKFPIAPYADGEQPNKFAKLMSTLVSLTPEKYRSDKSEGGMAAKIRQIRKAAKDRQREKKLAGLTGG